MAIAVGLAALALSAASNAQTIRSVETEGSARAEIRRLTQEFVAGFNAGDVDRMMKFYAPRYVDVNLRQPRQTWAQRRDYYRRVVSRRDTKVAVTPADITVAGDHAYAWGTIELTRTRPGPGPLHKTLRYMEIWRHFPEGWRSVAGMDAEIYPDK